MSMKCWIRNCQKVFKSLPDTWMYNAIKREGEVKSIQVRHKCTPAESPPKVKNPIPYVNPKFTYNKGGKLLLIIPAITFGLGTWQVKRLKWKEELIKTMEERQRSDPVPLPLDPEVVAGMEFCKVTVTGRFDHSEELFYGPKPCFVHGEVKRDVIHPSGQESLGYNLVTPFVLSDTGDRILVNRGWIRTKTIKKKDRVWSNTKGEELTLTGVIRLSEPPAGFGPSTDERYDIWHYRDITDIANKKDCLPIWIDATEEHSIPGKLWGGQTIMKIRNEHLSYIVTWYSLSILTAYIWYLRYMKR
ncbi:surfeit locus protein 1-like [Macrosteles quadrilineatus]|uniref:surfeit locus protein 1-like n=1 Tax=Macrosteles quadrilineatus TaxID=74068 RepID=UPI0023E32A63|nr:surfeit locus protein 1-like [Macrosteles quadrilineatus]